MVARWSIIQVCFRQASEAFARQPELFLAVHQQLKRLKAAYPELTSLTFNEDQLENTSVPKALRPFILQPGLADLMESIDILPETLLELQRLASSTLLVPIR